MIPVASVAVIAMVSCKQDNLASNTAVCKTAVVRYRGDHVADRMGRILVTDTASGQYEAAGYLYAFFKTKGLVVDIYYYKTGVGFICVCTHPVKQKIYLSSIKSD